ncbi:hypothetical protein AVEN_137815-1 [Araneus ventricosus]|uniref:Uncharacterized protein n=1 Tax=Araneus ventricosus TaxID=182803 RepID=A0A4Y2QM77_ARAVE|nr:hypothetical protein AVEN_33566-1 [Araneus ventricosus]GBN64422.1 hypothetical protein AVEN_137815-1 [Araneus ventricosus]
MPVISALSYLLEHFFNRPSIPFLRVISRRILFAIRDRIFYFLLLHFSTKPAPRTQPRVQPVPNFPPVEQLPYIEQKTKSRDSSPGSPKSCPRDFRVQEPSAAYFGWSLCRKCAIELGFPHFEIDVH